MSLQEVIMRGGGEKFCEYVTTFIQIAHLFIFCSVFWSEASISRMTSFSCTCTPNDCDNKHWQTVKLSGVMLQDCCIICMGSFLCEPSSCVSADLHATQTWETCCKVIYPHQVNVSWSKEIKCLILQLKVWAEFLNSGLWRERQIINIYSRAYISLLDLCILLTLCRSGAGIFVLIKSGFQGQRSNYWRL